MIRKYKILLQPWIQNCRAILLRNKLSNGKGNELLRAFQIGGYSESSDPLNWKLFTLEKKVEYYNIGRRII